MKRFQFSLERVLKLKKQRERMAELRLMQARAALELARQAIAAIHDQLAQNAAALASKVGNLVPVSIWQQRAEHSNQLVKRLELAEANERQAVERVREALAHRTQVAKEVETLVHLEDKEWQAHATEAMRQDQIRLDELGMRRWKMTHAFGDIADGN